MMGVGLCGFASGEVGDCRRPPLGVGRCVGVQSGLLAGLLRGLHK